MCLMEKRGEEIWIKIGRGEKIREWSTDMHGTREGGQFLPTSGFHLFLTLQRGRGEEVSIRLSL